MSKHQVKHKDDEFSSPLARIDEPTITPNSALLLVDMMGTNIKTDQLLTVQCNPAAMVNALCNQIRLGDV